jgi:hypothetical protein
MREEKGRKEGKTYDPYCLAQSLNSCFNGPRSFPLVIANPLIIPPRFASTIFDHFISLSLTCSPNGPIGVSPVHLVFLIFSSRGSRLFP